MHGRWLSLPLLSLTTTVSAFYPYQQTPVNDKRFYPLAPDRPTQDQDVYTLDVRRVKRQNAFNIVESSDPSQPHSLAVHQDGSDYSYLSTLQFGSRAQEMHMLIDTGSTNTWVFSSDCKSAPCSIHNTFGKDDSTTLNTTTKPFSLAYGTGEVDGVMAQDKVQFANYTLQLQFGLASQASDDFNNYPMDGILGLGLASSSDLGSQTVMQTLDNQAGLKTNILGIHLQRAADGAKDGTITIGGLDASKFNGDIAYTPIKSGNAWEIPVDDVFVAGTPCKFFGKSAIIDTGTSYALMPPSDAKTLHSLIPGSSSSGEAYTVPCDAQTTVEVSISKIQYSISPKDYVGKKSSGNICASNIIGHQPFGPDQWILGDIFLKNVYSVFDFDQARIGFGTMSGSPTSSTSSSSSSSSSSTASASASSSDSTATTMTTTIPTSSSTDSVSQSPSDNASPFGDDGSRNGSTTASAGCRHAVIGFGWLLLSGLTMAMMI